MNLQMAVEKIIVEELLKAKSLPRTGLLDRAFVVLMDPNTGDVLTMAGKVLARDEKTGKRIIQDYALGNISSSYNVGSSVKGATVLTGYKTGAIHPWSTFYDSPLYIKDTPEKVHGETLMHILMIYGHLEFPQTSICLKQRLKLAREYIYRISRLF